MRSLFFASLAALAACHGPAGTDDSPPEPVEAALDTSLEGDEADVALTAWGSYATWTAETSDEYPPVTCPSGYIAAGFDCDGSYCDNVQLRCQSSTGLTFGSRSWTSWFSEESTNYRICSGTGFVTGIACQNGNCDNMSLECTSTGRYGSSCVWSAYFSEEDPVFTAPTQTWIKGVQCSGSRCDNVRFYYCRE